MVSNTFKVYIADGQEFFIYKKDEKMVKASFPFFQSMLDLLYLDLKAYDSIFEEMGDTIPKLYATKDDRLAENIREKLEELAKDHIFFEYLLQDWSQRMEEIKQNDYIGIVELLPYRKRLAQIPENLRTIQGQVLSLLETVLDVSTSEKSSISEKIVRYYTNRENNGLSGFKFEPQSTCYEIIDKKTFTEVIYPTSIYSIIDFMVRECVKREIRFRVCKNCNRYFPLTGYANAEYCDRVFDDQGHTCKEMGALKVWQKKAKKPAYELYSKEYKKRFARIKYGKVTKEDFYKWAEEARTHRDRCMAEELSFEEFQEWIANN